MSLNTMKIKYLFKLLFFLLIQNISVYAQQQTYLDAKISYSSERTTIADFLQYLRSQNIPLTYTESPLLYDTLSIEVNNVKVSKALDIVFRSTILKYKEIGNQVVIYTEQKKYTISGYVSNMASGEKLINANIYNQHSGIGTTTNNYGFYSLTLPAGEVLLTGSYVGFSEFVSNFDLQTDTTINISLYRTQEIDEVLINDRFNNSIEKAASGQYRLEHKQITHTPALFGESDIMKTIQLYPGVNSSGDASNGLYIRGGSPDQNLLLVDGVPVYNATHLFGMFSIFNTDAIQSAKVYTGGIPAQYGGRLSSVIDIRLKEGNEKKFESEIDIGLISSKFEIETPLQKKQTTFVISGRRTYIDLFSGLIANRIARNQNINQLSLGYSFYDIYSKISHKFSQKSRLYLSFYTGNDDILYDAHWTNNQQISNRDYFNIGWGNIISSVRWNYMFSNKLFSNTTISYSKYKFDSENQYDKTNENRHSFSKYAFDYYSGIDNYSFHVDFDYLPSPEHFIRFGLMQTLHAFNPGIRILGEGKSLRDNILLNRNFGNQRIYAAEYAFYMGDDFKFSRLLKLNVGIRYAGFISKSNWYHSVEPRFSYNYRLSRNIALKAGIETMTQFVHLLSNNAIEMPTDLWLPATGEIKPQKSLQGTVGIFALPNNVYEYSGEIYYKRMVNLIEYKEAISFQQSDTDWNTLIERGEGYAYGLELMIKKPEGKINGQLSYTWAHSNRTFAGINSGEEFPAKYDRRHSLNLISQYIISKIFSINVHFTFNSGYPSTFPTAHYSSVFEGGSQSDLLWHYTNRNNYRLPAYHRLDIMAKMKKTTRYGERILRFGIYNVYNRKNPFYLYLETDNNTKRVKGIRQISLFPVLPIMSMAIKFK